MGKKNEILINDIHEYYDPFRSSCSSCAHFDNAFISCKAFREIPIVILQGENKHKTKFKGQIGNTVYEPVKSKVLA